MVAAYKKADSATHVAISTVSARNHSTVLQQELHHFFDGVHEGYTLIPHRHVTIAVALDSTIDMNFDEIKSAIYQFTMKAAQQNLHQIHTKAKEVFQ